MADELIGGKWKTNEEAIAGVRAADTRITELSGELSKLNAKLAEATSPKAPAFADDGGMMKFFGEKKIDLNTIGTKVIKENKYDPADMKVIGEAIREADPVWLGQKFAELHRHHTLTTIEASQQKVMKEIGGEARLKAMIDWQEKAATPEQKAEWANQWHGMDEAARRAAVERLEGRFARNNANVKLPAPSEGSTTPAGTNTGGFKDANEWRAAKNASQQKHGSKFYEKDSEYASKYASTPAEVRRTFTG